MATAETRKRALKADPEEFRPDPHPGYAKYRALSGLIDFGNGMPVVTRHEDAQRLLADPRTRQVETEALEIRGIRSGALHDFYANSMLLSNPPRHAMRRAPTARAFAFKLIDAWRPRVRSLMEELLDAAQADPEADFLEAIASPLPARLIAEVTGVPPEDAPSFSRLVYSMTRGLGAFRDEDFPAIESAAAELEAYVAGLLDDRRAHPQEDFLTDYLARVAQAGDLTETEARMQIATLVIGGSETTRFALTSMVGLLMRHRDQWESLCADPSLVPGAVREALRYEPPVGTIGRIVVEPLEVDGVALGPGSILQISLLSAQRDEALMADPERFDITREDHPKWGLSFGFGPHRCLGEALARAELEEALSVLTARAPGLTLAGPAPGYKGHTGIRGITPMRVRW